jgi:PadR family transcriptional regulator, regulatory protein PadR
MYLTSVAEKNDAAGARLGREEVRMLVLHVLMRGTSHGYAIARAVERDSGDALRMGEGTLYPVLRTLEHDGLVTSEWETADSGPARKVYRMTPAGRAEHDRRLLDWRSRVSAMSAVLGLGRAGMAGRGGKPA